MQTCASVRKKGSLDRCPARPVLGHTLCGRHARCKQPVLWIDVHRHRHAGLIRAQALVRGYLVRRRLALAGPGVLRRGDLSNDEDLVTLTEMSRLDPFQYIGFTENGKTWGFEFSSLFTWTLQTETPVNPYTKVPLTQETRVRLTQLWNARSRSGRGMTLSFTEACRRLAHVFQDSGFVDIGTESFASVSKSAWIRFFRLFQQELASAYPETSRLRRKGSLLCRRMEWFIPTTTVAQYCQMSTATLLRLLSIPRDPYLACFSVLSCFYRC